jgi:hypothetical protein
MLYMKRLLLICISILWLAGLVSSISAATRTIKPYASVIKLDDIGWYDVGYTYRNGKTHRFPLGWAGYDSDTSGIWCGTTGIYKGKDALHHWASRPVV